MSQRHLSLTYSMCGISGDVVGIRKQRSLPFLPPATNSYCCCFQRYENAYQPSCTVEYCSATGVEDKPFIEVSSKFDLQARLGGAEKRATLLRKTKEISDLKLVTGSTTIAQQVHHKFART